MIKVTGLKKLESKLSNVKNKTENGIYRGMVLILKESQPLVPVDTGALKRSGKITKIDNGYEISYHSENKSNGYNYAPIQHENLTFKHKVGEAKYLEKPIRQNIDKIKRIIIEEVTK